MKSLLTIERCGMPEEAHERLVKLYLESRGFLVLTNFKVHVAPNRVLEADIIAVRPLESGEDDLPDRIIGEAKAWQIEANHFKVLYDSLKLKSREGYKRFKILNDPEFKRAFRSEVESRYGPHFGFCIFAPKIAEKNRKLIEDFLKKEKIKFVPYSEVVEGIIRYAEAKSYSNDPELQLIRIMTKIGILNPHSQG